MTIFCSLCYSGLFLLRIYPYLEGGRSFATVSEMLQVMSPKPKRKTQAHENTLLDETQISLKDQVSSS